MKNNNQTPLSEKMMTPYKAVRKMEEQDERNLKLLCFCDTEDIAEAVGKILENDISNDNEVITIPRNKFNNIIGSFAEEEK